MFPAYGWFLTMGISRSVRTKKRGRPGGAPSAPSDTTRTAFKFLKTAPVGLRPGDPDLLPPSDRVIPGVRLRRRIYPRSAPPGGMPRAVGGRLDSLGMCGLLPHHSAQLLDWTRHGVPYTIVARGAGTRGRAVTVSSTSGATRRWVGFGALFTDGVRATADGRIDSRKVPLTLDDNRRGALEGTAVLAARRLSFPDRCDVRNRKPKPQSPMRAPRSRPPRAGAVWRGEPCTASA